MERAAGNAPFTLIPNWVIREGVLDPTELAIYLVLLSHRDHGTGLAWPGFDAISKQSRVSRSTVVRTIPKLEARGLIKVSRRRKMTGENEANVYTVAVFKRTKPVGNFASSGRPSFESSDKSTEGSATVTLPSVNLTPPPSVTVTPKEEPLLTRTIEEDFRSALTSGHEISFDTVSIAATQKQLDYLADLFVHFNNEYPTTANKQQWAAMDQGQAAILIDAYLSSMPRYDEYVGPEQGEETYTLLSPKGQQWADTGFIPEERKAS